MQSIRINHYEIPAYLIDMNVYLSTNSNNQNFLRLNLQANNIWLNCNWVRSQSSKIINRYEIVNHSGNKNQNIERQNDWKISNTIFKQQIYMSSVRMYNTSDKI